MPDTFQPIFDTRAAVARFEAAAQRGLVNEALDYRAELQQHSADIAAIFGWLQEAGVKATPLAEAAALLLDAISDADHQHVRTLDAAGRSCEAIALGGLEALARGSR